MVHASVCITLAIVYANNSDSTANNMCDNTHSNTRLLPDGGNPSNKGETGHQGAVQ